MTKDDWQTESPADGTTVLRELNRLRLQASKDHMGWLVEDLTRIIALIPTPGADAESCEVCGGRGTVVMEHCEECGQRGPQPCPACSDPGFECPRCGSTHWRERDGVRECRDCAPAAESARGQKTDMEVTEDGFMASEVVEGRLGQIKRDADRRMASGSGVPTREAVEPAAESEHSCSTCEHAFNGNPSDAGPCEICEDVSGYSQRAPAAESKTDSAAADTGQRGEIRNRIEAMSPQQVRRCYEELGIKPRTEGSTEGEVE